jgi:hypothetical protein
VLRRLLALRRLLPPRHHRHPVVESLDHCPSRGEVEGRPGLLVRALALTAGEAQLPVQAQLQSRQLPGKLGPPLAHRGWAFAP